MFHDISLISVPVSDQEAALNFYSKMLGCTIVQDVPFAPGTRWLRLALPGVKTELVLATWFQAMEPGSLQGVVLTTDDISKTHAELKSKGLAISDVSDEDYAKEATFADPDGNGWVLQQPKPQNGK